MSDRLPRGSIEKILSKPWSGLAVGFGFGLVLGLAAYVFKFADPFASALAGFILPLSGHFSYWMKSESEKRAEDFRVLKQDTGLLTTQWMETAFKAVANNFLAATRNDAKIWEAVASKTRADPFPFIYSKLVQVVAGTISAASHNESPVFRQLSGLAINEKRNHLEASVIFWEALAEYIRLRKKTEKFDAKIDVFVTHFFNPKYWSGEISDQRDDYMQRHINAQRDFLRASENDGIYRVFCRSRDKKGKVNFEEIDYIAAVDAHSRQKENRMHATIVRDPDHGWPENLDFVYIPSLKIAVIWKIAGSESLSIEPTKEPDQLVIVDLSSDKAESLHGKIRDCLRQCRDLLSDRPERTLFKQALDRELDKVVERRS